ncbi:MAG: flagellar hook-length control protein FliK [Succinivibrio sp.]|nr:flagellar hook-length control protein FliK [Succinivibrio sp.]
MQSINVNAPHREDSFAADGIKGQQAALGQDFASIFASFAGTQGNSSSISALLNSLQPQDMLRSAPKPNQADFARDRAESARLPKLERKSSADRPERPELPSYKRSTAQDEPDRAQRDERTERPEHEEREFSADRADRAEVSESAPKSAESGFGEESAEFFSLGKFAENTGMSGSVADAGESGEFGGSSFNDRREQNFKLFSALQGRVPQDSQKQQAAAQMMQFSDDKVQVDLKALTEGLKEVQSSGQQAEGDKLNSLMQKANVLQVDVKGKNLEDLVKNGRESAQDLSAIAESLNISSKLKGEGSSFLNGGESSSNGSSQPSPWLMQQMQAQKNTPAAQQPSLEAKMGDALSTLQKQLSGAESGALNEAKPAGMNGAEGVKAGNAAQAQEPLSFGQQVTAELNSVTKGQKSPEKSQLAENLRRNAEELAKQVMAMAARNLQSVELNLNPGELGKLKISIDVTGMDEVSKITVAASNPATRALVADTLPKLRELMLEQGMEVQAELDEESGFSEEQSTEQQDNQLADQHQDGKPQDDGVFFRAPRPLGEEAKPEDLAQSSQNEHTLNFFA